MKLIIVSTFLFIFGLIGVITGKFNIIGKYRVDGGAGRLMGIIMLAGAVAPFCIGGWFASFAQWGLLILAIAIGLASSEQTEALKSSAEEEAEPSPEAVEAAPDEQDDREARSRQDEAPNKLQRAITLIKSGDKQSGRSLLVEILKAEPRNETAWLWMSGIVANDEQRRYCLKQALTINPNNQLAKEGLAKLQHKV